MSPSLLDQIRAIIPVHVDSMDPQFALRHKPCCDMTSNQALAYLQGITSESAPLVQEAIAYVKKQGTHSNTDSQAYLLDVLDVLTVLLAKQVYPHITGKVHAQTSPTVATNIEGTKKHATKLVSLFEAHGIDRSRCCIKIPANPEGVAACRELQEEGINTLATAVASWEQCVAGMQAKSIYVAPYFNELRAHFNESFKKDYADPAKEHPHSDGIRAGIAALKGSRTHVMPASLISVKEIIGLVSLRPDCITIPGHLLDELSATPALPSDAFAPRNDLPRVTFSRDVDYVRDGGAGLKEVFAKQPEIARKVTEAITIFGSFERKAMEFIRSGKIDVEYVGVDHAL